MLTNVRLLESFYSDINEIFCEKYAGFNLENYAGFNVMK